MAYLISNMHSFCLPDDDSRNDMAGFGLRLFYRYVRSERSVFLFSLFLFADLIGSVHSGDIE